MLQQVQQISMGNSCGSSPSKCKTRSGYCSFSMSRTLSFFWFFLLCHKANSYRICRNNSLFDGECPFQVNFSEKRKQLNQSLSGSVNEHMWITSHKYQKCYQMTTLLFLTINRFSECYCSNYLNTTWSGERRSIFYLKNQLFLHIPVRIYMKIWFRDTILLCWIF